MAKLILTLEINLDEIDDDQIPSRLVNEVVLSSMYNYIMNYEFPEGYVRKAYGKMMSEEEIHEKIHEVENKKQFAQEIRNAIFQRKFKMELVGDQNED